LSSRDNAVARYSTTRGLAFSAAKDARSEGTQRRSNSLSVRISSDTLHSTFYTLHPSQVCALASVEVHRTAVDFDGPVDSVPRLPGSAGLIIRHFDHDFGPQVIAGATRAGEAAIFLWKDLLYLCPGRAR